ncbi:MAG: group 1 truncated hemoglobin [Kiloniellales bacterium]|nr:group 1 truncated hemoglobin [Kiloniellales bacterium]
MAQTMFERYGGFANVSKIVMAFYDKVLDSDVIGDYFEHVDLRSLVDHQTKFISQVMGGPEAYSNEALQRVHARLGIDAAAFDEMAAVLKETLEDFELEPRDIDHVVGHIRSLAKYIITT